LVKLLPAAFQHFRRLDYLLSGSSESSILLFPRRHSSDVRRTPHGRVPLFAGQCRRSLRDPRLSLFVLLFCATLFQCLVCLLLVHFEFVETFLLQLSQLECQQSLKLQYFRLVTCLVETWLHILKPIV
jgi:hypothetical protein